MSAPAAAAVAWLLTYAVHSTLLLGAAALLAARVLRSEAARETAWKAALVGGIVTATLQAALGYQPLVGRWRIAALEPTPAVAVAPEAARETESPVSMDEPRSDGVAAQPVASEAPSASPTPSPSPSPSPSPAPTPTPTPGGISLPWPLALAGVWLLGAVILLGRLAVRQAVLLRVLRDRRLVEDGHLPALVAELRRNAGVWLPVRLTASEACASPMALGSAEVCVPERFITRLDPEQQRCALAHELAHLARRDPWWHLAAGVVEAVFWVQPLNRVARLRMREAAEYLADDWAVRHTGSPLGLARCLAEVASWVAPGRMGAVPAGTLAMAEGGSPLVRRVERLLAGRGDSGAGIAARLAGAAALLAAVAVAAPTVAPLALEAAADAKSGAVEGGIRASATVDTQAVEVVRHPAGTGAIDARWRWAMDEARRRGGSGHWIGYAFTANLNGPPEVVLGDTRMNSFAETALPSLGRHVGAADPDVLVLFHVGPAGKVDRLALRSASAGVDLQRDPVFWLGRATQGESLDWLEGRMASRDPSYREELVDAVALHTDADRVVPYLISLLRQDGSRDVRRQAAEGLARHPSDRALAALRQAATGDGSHDVRREAVEAIGEMDLPAAERVLTEMLDPASDDISLRQEALEALAQRQTGMSVAQLTTLAMNDPDPAMQREAVELLAHYAPESVAPVLVRIAWTSRSPGTRSQAAESLGSLPPALGAPALDSIARHHPDPEVGAQAVESLGRYPAAVAEPLVRRIQRTAPHVRVRREAEDVLENLGTLGPLSGLSTRLDELDPDFDIDPDGGSRPGAEPPRTPSP